MILKVCELLTVKGGTNRVIEYFGPGTASISATGKGTITNMGAELGATTSIFPYDARMATYLKATGRERARGPRRTATPSCCARIRRSRPIRSASSTRCVEIDLSRLEPHVVGPHTPDLARPVSRLAADAQRERLAAAALARR